ncbi:hypothetical protein [Streptomyces sp. NPDC001930]
MVVLHDHRLAAALPRDRGEAIRLTDEDLALLDGPHRESAADAS